MISALLLAALSVNLELPRSLPLVDGYSYADTLLPGDRDMQGRGSIIKRRNYTDGKTAFSLLELWQKDGSENPHNNVICGMYWGEEVLYPLFVSIPGIPRGIGWVIGPRMELEIRLWKMEARQEQPCSRAARNGDTCNVSPDVTAPSRTLMRGPRFWAEGDEEFPAQAGKVGAENERITPVALRIKSGKHTPIGSNGLENTGPRSTTILAQITGPSWEPPEGATDMARYVLSTPVDFSLPEFVAITEAHDRLVTLAQAMMKEWPEVQWIHDPKFDSLPTLFTKSVFHDGKRVYVVIQNRGPDVPMTMTAVTPHERISDSLMVKHGTWVYPYQWPKWKGRPVDYVSTILYPHDWNRGSVTGGNEDRYGSRGGGYNDFKRVKPYDAVRRKYLK